MDNEAYRQRRGTEIPVNLSHSAEEWLRIKKEREDNKYASCIKRDNHNFTPGSEEYRPHRPKSRPTYSPSKTSSNSIEMIDVLRVIGGGFLLETCPQCKGRLIYKDDKIVCIGPAKVDAIGEEFYELTNGCGFERQYDELW